jgi:hypothetical protein
MTGLLRSWSHRAVFRCRSIHVASGTLQLLSCIHTRRKAIVFPTSNALSNQMTEIVVPSGGLPLSFYSCSFRDSQVAFTLEERPSPSLHLHYKCPSIGKWEYTKSYLYHGCKYLHACIKDEVSSMTDQRYRGPVNSLRKLPKYYLNPLIMLVRNDSTLI